jgi:integrase
MRHTAATLWLAAGEAPEWIARQLGHTSTEMLFRVYSRYVPNLTRQDGSAMDRLLATRFSTSQLVLEDATTPDATYVPGQPIAPQPVPKPRGLAGSRSAKDGAKPQPPPRYAVRFGVSHAPAKAALHP